MINKAIISGGGTGGHIFPAIAIANELKKRNPNCEILFIGAEGKMEMEKVPAAGYKIIGLPIRGFQRKFSWSNFSLPFKIIKSLLKAKKIIKEFQPDIVIGVGGYASGPSLKAAISLKIPTLIQEQNSFPGKTNIYLSKKVNKICTAYEQVSSFFPKEKIVLTGNPIRKDIVSFKDCFNGAHAYFELDKTKKTILVIGGSLGARTLNQSILHNLDLIKQKDIQILWQCGKFYAKELKQNIFLQGLDNIKILPFILDMNQAYAAADIIISRAGALSVSELSIVQKPTILVPSPNVAEDHQTKNAQALVENDAAVLIKDIEANDKLFTTAFDFLYDEEKKTKFCENMKQFAKPNASESIVDEIEKLV